jgi:hypothetical protein
LFVILLPTYLSGVEFVFDKEGNLWTFDVNTNTNYSLSAEKTVFGSMTGMLEIAKFLQSELQKVLGTTLPLEPKQEIDSDYSKTGSFVYPRRFLSGLGAFFANLAVSTGLAS